MIPTLEVAGFFMTIAAVLKFSSWAEGWLALSEQSIQEGAPGAMSSAASDFSEPGTEHEAIRVA